MDKVLEIIKTALNLGLIFLDVLEAFKNIYQAVMEKMNAECATAT
jgi:hypothetical protein